MTKETYKMLRACMQTFEVAAHKHILDNPELDSEDKIYELSSIIEAASQLSIVVEVALREEKWFDDELWEQYNASCIDNP